MCIRDRQQALKHFAIGGIKSNIPFLQVICKHPRFIEADLSTSFLAEETITLPVPEKHSALLMAAAFDYLDLVAKEHDPLFIECFAWQMHLSCRWSWRYLLETEEEQ